MFVGSVGKKVMVLFVLMFYEDGLLDIDDILDIWLFNELVECIEYGIDIIFCQLFIYIVGVYDYFVLDIVEVWFEVIMLDFGILKIDVYVLVFFIDKVGDFVLGIGFNYFNSGYLLIGLILDSVLGEYYVGVL